MSAIRPLSGQNGHQPAIAEQSTPWLLKLVSPVEKAVIDRQHAARGAVKKANSRANPLQ
jgi:hypothetical protein